MALIVAIFVVTLAGTALIALLSVLVPQPVGVAVAMLAALATPLAALYAAIRLTCIISVIAFEDLPLFAAVKRTWSLSAGKFWRMLGIILLFFGVLIAFSLVMMLIEALFGSFAGQGSTAIVARTVVQLVLGPFIAVLYFLLPVAIYRVLRDGETAEAVQA